MDTITLMTIATVAATNVVATVMVLRDRFLTAAQRRNQLVLTWALPILGAAVVITVNRAQAHQPPAALPPGADTDASQGSVDRISGLQGWDTHHGPDT
jgi:hypothetical protein